MEWKETIEKIAKSVRANSNDWVLVLGNGISYDSMQAANREFTRQIEGLQHDNKSQNYVREKVCQAVQKKDYVAIKDILYGDIWDGVSFLHAVEEEQKARRESYAKKFAVKERMNLECYKKIELHSLLKAFQGIILTTCQDETIEAFLEEQSCMSVGNQICTPYSLTTSPYWKRWPQDSRVLVKLYGTCTEPYHMLLSKSDMKMYYPEESAEGEVPHTVKALDDLFKTKNLLFIGMESNDNFALPPGIAKLLQKEPELQKHMKHKPQRYIILEEGKDAEKWKKLHAIPVDFQQEVISYLLQEVKKSTDSNVVLLETMEENEEEVGKDVEELNRENANVIFWDIYNRRPKHHVSIRENHILEYHIWQEGKVGGPVRYNRQGIEMLAMAANNFADFDDLWKVIDITRYNHKGEVDLTNERVIEELLKERIGRRSQELLQLLYFYGEGFPMGFLDLIAEDEEELSQWKRAGIQLTNSGIYVQSHNRKKVYEQMEYADALIQTAGSNPNKAEFGRRIKDRERQMEESYFYPVKIDIFENEDKSPVKKKYQQMLSKLVQILKEKSEEYNHIRSLLETELPAILRKIDELDDPALKPDLLYYLFRECQILPDKPDDLLKEIEIIQKELAEDGGGREALCKKLMLYQVRAIILSQKRNERAQRAAIELCVIAEEAIEKFGAKKEVLDESIFVQQIQLCLLKSKISGKLGSIKEIERCHNEEKRGKSYEALCKAQKDCLENMRKHLKEARDTLKRRSEKTGASYGALYAEIEYQYGEYCFKQSQFHSENRKYWDTERKRIYAEQKNMQAEKKAEGQYYSKAEEHYKNALDFYRKYPEQYKMQEAGVLRAMADLYCRMESSGEKEYKKYKRKCYIFLEDAYIYYRSYNNLHGIADVLQSMGETEDFSKKPEDGRRSAVCFYHAADKLYSDLGDEWSRYVLEGFLEDVKADLKRNNVIWLTE